MTRTQALPPEMLPGHYQRDPKENNWHERELKQEGDKHSPRFRWTNQAGVSWVLTFDLAHARLLCAKGSPYSNKETGSGFIIHPDGYIVTNGHVVARSYEMNERMLGEEFLETAVADACGPAMSALPANQRKARLRAIMADPGIVCGSA